ncbi:MAG: hypothetical protein ACTSQN_16625 [Candidatus Heimdallarchaeota archaeon]
MAKLRLEAIALLVIATLGFVLYASIPIAVDTDSVYLDDDNWADATIKYYPFGNAVISVEGELGGIPFTEEETYTAKDFDDYNHGLWALPLFGFLLALGAGVLYLLDLEKIPKFIMLIAGILGGLMMATGGLFVFDWVFDFVTFGGTPTIKMGAAFYIGLISGLLVIAATIFVFFFKRPKAEAAEVSA